MVESVRQHEQCPVCELIVVYDHLFRTEVEIDECAYRPHNRLGALIADLIACEMQLCEKA